jgi:2'-5' RNA ligase
MPPASSASTMFLGLEADARLAERICTYKRRVHALVGPQTFLDHPPHLTLYLAAFANGAAVADSVAHLVRELPAIRTSIVGWHTFWADQLTGRHTLVCQLDDEAVNELREIQHRAIAALAPLRHVKVTAARYASRLASLSATEQAAIASSGFPFTGEHWHPHLTIASINAADWPAIERELLPNPPSLDGCFPALALYRLVDEHPIMLRRFPLAPVDAAALRNLRLAS